MRLFSFWKKGPRDSRGRPAIGRGDIRKVVETWSESERYDLYATWVARYLPIWHAAYPIYAEKAELKPEKRELHTLRMTELIERCAALRAGEKMPKARLNETDSAVSALTWYAPNLFGVQPWTTRVRAAAMTGRQFLHVAKDSASPQLVAQGVYSWAMIESGFPGDSSALLMDLTMQERQAAGLELDDGHHLVFDRPCRERGLEAEGRAVYDAVADIMENLRQDPGPFHIDDDFWVPKASQAADHRAEAYERFHAKAPPKWFK